MRKNILKNNGVGSPLMHWLLIAVFVCALMNGCALLYFPMLILVPFQPILMIAAKIAARYGPLLLLLVETDPALPGTPPTMIAVSPADANQCTELCLLDTRLAGELDSNPGLVSVALVESATMTEAWLERQVADAHAQGCQVRLVFVDSRKYRNGVALPDDLIRKINERGVSLLATHGLAYRVAGTSATAMPPGKEAEEVFQVNAGYNTLAGALCAR